MVWRSVSDPGGVGKLHEIIDKEGGSHMGIGNTEGRELAGGEAGEPVEEIGALR